MVSRLQEPGRIAFVTSTPLSIAGGSGTYVGIRQLARSLEARKIRVAMFAPTWWSPSFTLKRLLFNLHVASQLQRHRDDWVVGFDLDGFHYGRVKAAPYIASIKGVIADELRNERGLIRAMLRLQAALERLAVHRADVVIATSRYSRDRIASAYGILADKIGVVPEPIDLRAWVQDDHEDPARLADPPAILTVAHLYPRKNLGVLLQAYARLRDAGIRFQGWIVGEGPCRKVWERLRGTLRLEDRVKFFGTLSRRDLVDRYRRASIFCLPSRQEGFGIVFLEAMACGRPIVAGRAAAVPETVPDGEVGVLVETEDPDALARALAGLLFDGDRRHAMGEAGRRRAEQFRADRVATGFLETVQSALAGRPGLTSDVRTWAEASSKADRQPVGLAGKVGG